MYGPTCIFWANLTPLALAVDQARYFPQGLDVGAGAEVGMADTAYVYVPSACAGIRGDK
jgi:hypothetical protein